MPFLYKGAQNKTTAISPVIISWGLTVVNPRAAKCQTVAISSL